MKRMVCLVLAVLLLIPPMTGCGERLNEPVRFYYLRKDYQESMDSPIASEEREASGHRENLKYLLSFYLMGPVSEELVSPLPRGVILYTLKQDGSNLSIELSDTSASLSDSAFSLACACLTLTCTGLTSVDEVTVSSGSRSLTMSAENLTLTDNVVPEESTK